MNQDMKNVLVAAGVATLVVLVGFVFVPRAVYNTYPKTVERPLGSTPGNNFGGQVEFAGGVVNSTLVATSSSGASITVTANEFTQWANSGVVSFTQGLMAAATLTFPASSTVSNLVPRPGDRQTFCIRNATTTSARVITLAGSTGINLNVASSSATALGSAVIRTGEVGCLTLIRQASTATTYDIDALFTVFQ